MNPAISVVLLTTLCGAAQGLLLALWALDTLGGLPAGHQLLPVGAGLATGLAGAGLVASFFHLGRPERAWRAAAMWRTSWLSREVIALPLFMAASAGYAAAALWWPALQPAFGALAALAAVVLFVCTGMIYACLRFLREWATPLTPLNFAVQGLAHGATVAAALAAATAQPFALAALTQAALVFTAFGWLLRRRIWRRNAGLQPVSTIQTAIGVRHPVVRQTSMGFMGGSFNTREFFHGRSPAALRLLRQVCMACAFVIPLLLLGLARAGGWLSLPAAALAGVALVQWLGLLAERWLFFAEARHPQNLYYQRMA